MLKSKGIIFLLLAGFIFVGNLSACTIGAASGRATADGRPMIWKTRDTYHKNNEVFYNDEYKYKFIGVINAEEGDPAIWQGVNEKGFAILNSQSSDLKKFKEYSSDKENGTFMRKALGYCASVAEFEELLKRTNNAVRETTTNFAVMDAAGEAAIFETANERYRKFDATCPNTAPKGYVARSNFAFSAGEQNNRSRKKSMARYKRTSKLLESFYADGKVSYKDILRGQMRDFSDKQSKTISVPFRAKWSPEDIYGYVECYYSICRNSTVSTSVFVGVLDGEDPRLSTMWTILGQPAAAVAIPYWPVGKTPVEADGEVTAPLCDAALKIKSLLFDYKKRYIDTFKLRDDKGDGLWKILFPAEDRIFAETEAKLAKWRKSGPEVEEMLTMENKLAAEVLELLNKTYEKLQTWKPERGKLKEPADKPIKNQP